MTDRQFRILDMLADPIGRTSLSDKDKEAVKAALDEIDRLRCRVNELSRQVVARNCGPRAKGPEVKP